MRKITLLYSLNILAILCVTTHSFAQVGINTTDPKGILDITSSTTGLVYPNVSLTAANVASPVVNPQGGALVDGTVVYNTNTTFTGTTNDVYPGIYTWYAASSKWLIHYKKRQSELFNQTSLLRTQADAAGGYEDVPGLGISDANSFTAKYSGLYRIEVKTNFGAGRTYKNTSMYVAKASGNFRFAFDIDNDGTSDNNDFETSAYSAYSSYINPGSDTYYEDIWGESYDVFYVNLTADAIYPFSLAFDAYDAPGFIGNGSTSAAGADPTSVDLINENFDSYSITQINASIGCGSSPGTNGWVIGTGICTACAGNSLYINANENGCTQDATALMSFTPTVTTVDISFDYRLNQRTPAYDSFRVYLHDGTSQVGANLVFDEDTDSDTSFSGTVTLVAGIAHTLRIEYITSGKGNAASADNVVISELSGPPTPPSELGRAYVGNEVDCQIEFTYIGE